MTNRPERLLITGGAGYIGSTLTALALKAGFQVRVLDNLSFGGEALLPYLNHERFDLIKGDLRSESDLKKSLEKIDAVIHLAAIVGDPACAQKPDEATAINKTASEQLCEIALKKKIERFVFASTCSNYGRMTDADGFVNEESELRPVSHYAELKVGFENYLFNLDIAGFTPVCLRFATAFGLSARPRFDLTVNEFTRELVLGRTLEVFGEQFWRPYCHVADLARACLLSVEAPREQVAYKAFNVGSNEQNYQKKQIIDLILKRLPGKEKLIKYVKRDEDPRDYRVRFDRITAGLGFSITKTVSDGINEIIDAIEDGLIKDPDNKQYVNL